MNPIELSKLLEWEGLLKSGLEELSQRRQELDAQLQHLSRKLELVRQMRSLEEPPQLEAAQSSAEAVSIETRPTPTGVREMARRVIAEAGHPIHITEIHRQFVDKGYPIPGGGTPFNILAHIVNDKTFVRIARGTYALTGTVPEEQVLPRAPRKRGTKKKKRVRRS
jgi:hypothetical protein